MDGRRTNLAFARSILCNLTWKGHKCIVLDVDALYSSSSDYVLAPLSESQAQAIEIIVPDTDSDLEPTIASLIASGPGKMIIVDSLNSLYHLLSTEGRGYRGRKLAFVMACFSYLARTGKGAVLVTMYQRERTTRFGGGRQISSFSDHTIFVDLRDATLTLRYDRGYSQSGEAFSLPIPSC